MITNCNFCFNYNQPVLFLEGIKHLVKEKKIGQFLPSCATWECVSYFLLHDPMYSVSLCEHFFHSDIFCHCRLSYISFGYGVFIFLEFKEVAGFFLRFSFTSKMLFIFLGKGSTLVKSCFATENQSDIIMLANLLNFSCFLKCAYCIYIMAVCRVHPLISDIRRDVFILTNA